MNTQAATGAPELHPRAQPEGRGAWARRREEWLDFWRRYRKNRLAVVGAAVVFIIVLVGIFAPLLAPHDPTAANFFARLRPPAWQEGGSWDYPLGTDHLGRDIFSRLLYGTRVSLAVGSVVIFISTTVGVLLGLVSGYYGGRVDTIIQRFADILLSFPYLILAIGLMAVMGPGFGNMIAALVYRGWVTSARVVRGEVLSAKEQEYVEAARAVGAGNSHIMWREILPNTLSSAIVVASLGVATVILMEASLSFLGLGVQPPTPAWGSMVADGRDFIFQAWWIATFPGLAILVTVLGVNLMGEGLRDALDPRLRE